MNPILRMENLQVEYRSRELGREPKLALKGLNLCVGQGEVFGFLGPNGAGKTMAINVLLGFLNATSGAAYVFGVNARQPIARQRIGYLPELTYYYKFLSAEELLRFYARIFRIPKAKVESRIDAVLKLVELEQVRRRLIGTYSKGMQQRLRRHQRPNPFLGWRAPSDRGECVPRALVEPRTTQSSVDVVRAAAFNSRLSESGKRSDGRRPPCAPLSRC
ncbi:MAG: ABC transporter ATP-binding protein [Verrucomicrobiota bacterium]